MRVSAVAVGVGAFLVALGGVLEAWSFTGVAAAFTFVSLGALVVVMGRRQLRATERAEASQVRVASALQREVAQERVLGTDVQELRSAVGNGSRDADQVVTTIAHLDKAITALSKAQDDDRHLLDLKLTRLHSSILTDAQALGQLMARFNPLEPLPPVGGWAMSPSGLLWLTRHVLRAKPRLIVECGSGTSTLWVAMALREVGRGKVITFEHDPEFASRTRNRLADHGLSEWVDVIEAPLEPVVTPRGSFDWYSRAGRPIEGIDLLLIDGPPGKTGPNARYPARQLIVESMSDGAIIVVDDMHRKDEQDAVTYWLEEVEGLSTLGEIAKDIVALRFSKP